jgi:hypothetical protein
LKKFHWKKASRLWALSQQIYLLHTIHDSAMLTHSVESQTVAQWASSPTDHSMDTMNTLAARKMSNVECLAPVSVALLEHNLREAAAAA